MSQNDVGSVPFSWLPAYGEAVEHALSSSRNNMLETILEETSDDEDSSEIWNNSGDWETSNSESVTNSVIEVDLNQDSETLSERDFICPAKRRRQDNDGSVETNFILRRPTSDGDKYRVLDTNTLEVPDFIPKRNELRYRFDEIGLTPDMYSDSDSLSYNSLSRSSSLIQFESLERQLLQTDNGQQKQSGSTPILSGGSSSAESSTLPKVIVGVSTGLSEFERMLCRKNTNSLMQNVNGGRQVSMVVPDVVINDDHVSDSSDNSYSSGVDESTSSSFSSEESYYLNHSSDKNSEDDEELNEEEEIVKVGNRNISSDSSSLKKQCVNGNVIAFNRRFSGSSGSTNNASCSVNRNIVGNCTSNNNVRNKNSVESLSEDSGFCDQSISNNLRRVKSKSNPSLNVLDNGHFSVNAILNHNDSNSHIDDDIFCKSMEDLSKTKMETRIKNNNNRGTTKIIESRRTDSKNNSQNSVSERQHTTTAQRKILINVNSQQEKISRQKRVKSSSSPELRSSDNKTEKNNFSRKENSEDHPNDLFHVSSVPNNLNLCGDPGETSSSASDSHNKISTDSIATHNVNLFHLNSPINSTPSVIPINPSLTASYANLTLLNYSDDPTMAGNNTTDLLSNRKYATGGADTTKSEFSSLLEEITAHFDRNLSILNDQHECYEPSVRTIYEEPVSLESHPIPVTRPKKQPPLPPPRKSSKNKILSPTLLQSSLTPQLQQLESKSNNNKNSDMSHQSKNTRDECDYALHLSPPSYTEYLLAKNRDTHKITFDQDPTNLRTTYTESLEHCNFESTECLNVDMESIRANMVSPTLGVKGKELNRQKQIHGRALIQSTPNLNVKQFKSYEIDDSLEHHNSLKDVTMSTFMGQKTTSSVGEDGNGPNTGSKPGLSKGVSFCPIVSEISWKETKVSDDSLSGASSNSSNGIPAYPTYVHDDEDLEDDELIALENYRTNNHYDDEDDSQTKSWINEDEMIGKTEHCGEFGEYLLPIYNGGCSSVGASTSGVQQNMNTFTTTFTIDKLDKQQNKQQDCSSNNNDRERRHLSVVHIPIVNNNPVDEDRVKMNERDNKYESNCTSSGELTTAIHKVPEAERYNSVKMYASEKRSNSGAVACNADTSGATAVSNKPVLSHNLVSAGNNNKNIKNNQMMMNNQKINKASYLDAVSSVNNNGHGNVDNSTNSQNKVQVANLMTNKNNNIEKNLNNKFEVQKVKKKDGFLSRISSGLRFSFRGKKGSKSQTSGNSVYNYNQFEGNQQVVGDYAKKQNMKVTRQNNQDIVFIPLKDPTTENVQSFIQHEIEHTHIGTSADNSHTNNNHMLHKNKKPPIPSKPPRPFVTGRPPIHPKSVHAQQQRGSSLSPPRDTAATLAYHEIVPANQLRAATLSGKYNASTNDDDDMGSEQKIGLIETNLDTHETIITGKTQSLMELGGPQNYARKGHTIGPVSRAIINSKANKTIIGNHHHNDTLDIDGTDANNGRPHKSMEFLLDKDNHQQVLPPENELQKSHETNTNLSEHQLRVQASLQRLNVPDWYKTYSSNQSSSQAGGNRSTLDSSGFLRKRNSDVGRWTGLSSKTTSLSSLGSQRSDRSPVMLSPSSHSHHGQTGFSRWSTSHLNSNQTSPSVSTRGSFSRGVLSAGGYQSTGNTLRGSYRQPYLGWRSQEKLAQQQQQTTVGLRTPAERLASSLLQQKHQQKDADSKPPIPPHHQHQYQQQQSPSSIVGTPEIKDEIKEVTSAIVHYVNDQQNKNSRSRSTSPSQRCWLESSFVGTKPLESPQTPVIDNTTTVVAAFHSSSSSSLPRHHATPNFRLSNTDGRSGVNGTVTVPTFHIPPERPTSAMLLDEIDVEDVLTSLLGLPANNSRPEDIASDPAQPISLPHMQLNQEPGLPQIDMSSIPMLVTPTSVTTTIPARVDDAQNTQQLHVEQPERRHSEGDTIHQRRKTSDPTIAAGHLRKLSLDSYESKNSEVVRCRYPRCDSTTTSAEAKKTYKSCHNCSHLYCSRECRRSHWEKHRKACLHSRVSALCRQVLSACKDDADTLRHLSLLARRGFLSQGRGVIRILFRSPENADLFIKQGFQCLGEVMYVRWPDLMPAEMGAELYSELLRLSTEYKPESKMLLYVAICVVSEAPAASTGQVKWERQLVSRCAKLKLCKSIINDMAHQQPIFTQQFSSSGSGTTTSAATASGTSSSSVTTANTSAPDSDVLILKFSLSGKRNTQKYRELIFQNIQSVLRQKGVSMRKHFPEVFQRLASYVEGTTDRFVPVTIHPRDTTTGRGFVCIIMPVTNENEVKIPTSSDSGSKVTILDVGIETIQASTTACDVSE